VRGWWTAAAWGAAGVLLWLALLASPAGAADFGIVPGSLEIKVLDSDGHPDTRAGAHPDRLQVGFQLVASGTGTSARDYVIEFGPGLGGSPSTGPLCPRAVFEEETCPRETQVGVFVGELNGSSNERSFYSIAPAPTQLAAFGVKPLWKTQFEVGLSPVDYGLRLQSNQLPQFPSDRGEVELWGVPADHLSTPPPERTALLTTPTRCGPLKVTFRTRSWKVGAPWLSETAETPPFTGCEDLPFAPRIGFTLGDRTVDSPTGARVKLSVPEHPGPDERTSSQIRDARVDLPPGLTISPGGAQGLQACSDAQFGVHEESPAACPPLSRVGSAEISAAQFDEPLKGAIYLGHERPGARFRLFVDVATRGAELKALGRLTSDPDTARLAVVLNDLPQLSFSDMDLNFAGGSRALLATPLSCGAKTARGRFAPYTGGDSVDSSATVNVGGAGGSPCPANPPFSPGVTVGSTQTQAGGEADLLFTLTRQDGEQLPKRFSTTLPAGVGVSLGSIEPCSGGAVEMNACPGTSRIGSAVAEVGSGSSPALMRGNVYLTDAYKGAPFGLSIIFKVSVGPFDLGGLLVRGTMRLNRRTGQITLATDPLPTTFEGIPLRFRTIGMTLDRSGLLRNPTSCQPGEIVSTIRAVDGRVVSTSSPFAVRGCSQMAFRPTFKSTLIGHRGRHGNRHPGMRFAIRMSKRGTNLRRFRVKFPRVLAFHGGAVKAICARGDAPEDACPRRARVGTGIAHTPLMSEPLRGPIYLVRPEGNGLPGLWSSLGTSGVKIDVAGRTLRRDGHLLLEMAGLPDMPLSNFTMRIGGGESGLFSLEKGLCRMGRPRRLVSPVAAEAQNGAYRLGRIRLRAKALCGPRQHTKVERHHIHRALRVR